MRIAVTGRFGQIARLLVERGPNSNVDVLTLARPAVDLAQPHDLADALAALRPQAVVSAAAYTAVDLAESEPLLANQINANGAEALARATWRYFRFRSYTSRLTMSSTARLIVPIARMTRPVRLTSMAQASCAANNWWPPPIRITLSFVQLGSTARSARTLRGPCCHWPPLAMRFRL